MDTGKRADPGVSPSIRIPCTTLPHTCDIVVSGEWVQRLEGDWRDGVDLATADRPTVYAAGRADGYRQAWAEMGALHQLIREWLEALT